MSIPIEMLERGSAYGQYEYVVVTFPTANVDVRIRHNLKAIPATEVYYTVVKQDRAASVYTGDTTLWSPQFITLKSNTASLSATILLFTRNA